MGEGVEEVGVLEEERAVGASSLSTEWLEVRCTILLSIAQVGGVEAGLIFLLASAGEEVSGVA